jgi:hypothetical protein
MQPIKNLNKNSLLQPITKSNPKLFSQPITIPIKITKILTETKSLVVAHSPLSRSFSFFLLLREYKIFSSFRGFSFKFSQRGIIRSPFRSTFLTPLVFIYFFFGFVRSPHIHIFFLGYFWHFFFCCVRRFW